MQGSVWVGEAITCLPCGNQATKDTVSKAFSWENPDSRIRVLVGETGQEEMRDARETEDEDGE